MTINFYILCFISGLCGVLFNVFAIKIPGVKKLAKVGNAPAFSYKTYFEDDLAAILACFLSVIVFLVVLDEILAYQPAIMPFVKIGFFFVGISGSEIIISLLGKYEDKIHAVIDAKTDIADGVIRIEDKPADQPQ